MTRLKSGHVYHGYCLVELFSIDKRNARKLADSRAFFRIFNEKTHKWEDRDRNYGEFVEVTLGPNFKEIKRQKLIALCAFLHRKAAL